MSIYAKIYNGDVTQYPANPRGDHPQTSFSVNWQGGVLGDDEYVAVVESAQPAFDQATQKIVEVSPVQVSGVWTQQWLVVDLTAQELAAMQNAQIAVSARQIRQALTQTGFRGAVESAVANGDQDLQDWWEFEAIVHSDHPLVDRIVAAIGATDADKRAVFALAPTL